MTKEHNERHLAGEDSFFQDFITNRSHRLLVAPFIVAIFVFVATLLFGLRALEGVHDSSKAVAQTYSLKAALEHVLTTLLDAETGERGFIITGMDNFLDSYNQAQGAIASDLAQVRALTADNAEDQDDLRQLMVLADLKMNELGNIIRRRQESGFTTAEKLVATIIPQQHMDEMRAIVTRITAREDALLAVRQARADRSYRRAQLTRLATTAMSLLVVAALFFTSWRSTKYRVRATTTAERLRVTLASIGDAVLTTDDRGRITGMNDIATTLTGWTPADAVGRRFEEVFAIVNEESGRTVENPIEKVLREGKAVELANHTLLLSKDGRRIPIDDSAAPIRTANGRTSGVVLVFRDITARRQVEQDRAAFLEAERNAKRAAEESSHAKDQFLAILSHELRTPLSSIIGWCVMLRSGKLSMEQSNRALSVIEQNARVEADLVESLLDLSRITAGKLKLEMEQVDLAAIVRAAVDSLRPQADAKGVMFRLDVPENPIVTVGDPSRLHQVLSNLLSNAIKFTRRTGQVQVVLTRAESQARIRITDDGEGIPSDLIPHIFDRFRQAQSAEGRAHGGLGLGLAIVRELTLAHGGTVAAYSAGKGHGSTFTVALPIPAVIPDAVAATLHKERQDVEPSISELRILVVDDDIDARALVALALESRGAIVQTASTAREAFEVIRSGGLDALVSDIAMPDEDGYALIKKVRAYERQRRARRLPAIALTAFAPSTNRDQALTSGFDLHLAKPVEPITLARALVKYTKSNERAA